MIKKSCSNCANTECFARGKCEYCSNWRGLENTQKPHKEPDMFTPKELQEALAEECITPLLRSPRCSGKKFLISLAYQLDRLEKLEEQNAEVDWLARFHSRVCQLLGVGCEAADETILKVLNEAVHGSWKPTNPKTGVWLKARIGGDDYFKCSECGVYIEATFFANDYPVNCCPSCCTPMERGER